MPYRVTPHRHPLAIPEKFPDPVFSQQGIKQERFDQIVAPIGILYPYQHPNPRVTDHIFVQLNHVAP